MSRRRRQSRLIVGYVDILSGVHSFHALCPRTLNALLEIRYPSASVEDGTRLPNRNMQISTSENTDNT